MRIPDRFVCGGLFLGCVLATAGELLPAAIFQRLLVVIFALAVVAVLACVALAFLHGEFFDSLDEKDAE